MGEHQRREFHKALLDADSFEDLAGKWQAAILKADQNRPKAVGSLAATKTLLRDHLGDHSRAARRSGLAQGPGKLEPALGAG
jgi:hypothetical protein